MYKVRVVYNNDFWLFDLPVRESLFADYKQCNPNEKVILTHERYEYPYAVFLREVELYSVDRNLSCFARRI